MNKKLILLILITVFLYIAVYISVYHSNNPFVFSKFNFNKNLNDKVDKIRTVVINEEDATIDVVKKASPAVVSVMRNDIYYDFRNGPITQENSIGTGFIIDGTKGIILTNKHVVEDEQASYTVVLSGSGDKYDVTKIARDPLNDFSILEIKLEDNQVLPELELADSDKLQIGQTVIAIGNALGEFGNSVTKGIISGLNRGILASSGVFGNPEYLEDVIQTDAALNPGNSGGPLLNLQAQVVGINVAVSGSAENIGFSIPINTIKPALEQFNTRGKISRPFLGVQYRVVTADVAKLRDIPEGAFVESIVNDSPAEKAKIKPGDIITHIDSVKLDESNTLAKLISKQQIDQKVKLTVYRDGSSIEIEAVLQDADKE